MKAKQRFPIPGTPPAMRLKRVSGEGKPPEFRVVEYSATSFEEKKFNRVADLPAAPPLAFNQGFP